MEQIFGSAIGALAVICIPLIGWFSRRVTPEGRLTLRVERLGSVYALMPESPEKDEFKAHVTSAIKNLNGWLDPDTRRKRRVIQGVSVAAYLLGVSIAFIVINSVDESAKFWLSPLIGVGLGVAITAVAGFTALGLERQGSTRDAKAAKAIIDAAAAERMEALRRGLPIPGQVVDGGKPA